jgi:hypothetical protein
LSFVVPLSFLVSVLLGAYLANDVYASVDASRRVREVLRQPVHSRISVDDGTGTHTERPGGGRTTHLATALVRGCPSCAPIALVFLVVVVMVVVMVVAMVVIVVAVVVAVAVVVHLSPSLFSSSF